MVAAVVLHPRLQNNHPCLVSGSIKRMADFLNSFDTSCRSRLSGLDEKLTRLERKVTFLEARTSGGALDVTSPGP